MDLEFQRAGCDFKSMKNRRSIACVLGCAVLLAVGCAKDSAADGAKPDSATATAADAASSRDASFRDASSADASQDSAQAAVACTAKPRAGDHCANANETCGSQHCGVSRALRCTGGVWIQESLSWQGDSTPWDFDCSAQAESSGDLCQNEAQCCGETVAEPTGCSLTGGCKLCPDQQPADGTACQLPAACDGSGARQVIDCYYPCCCYGTVTWAQCNGERWHVYSTCTPK